MRFRPQRRLLGAVTAESDGRMLAELLHHLATPAPGWSRRQGFLGEAVSLWARGRRCRRHWADHEGRTRAVFERAIGRCGNRRTAIVLGSGLLRDVPIERLRRNFERVILVDAVHLASVRLRARIARWNDVDFETRDLSGFDDLLERERLRIRIGGREVGGRLDPLAFLRDVPDLDLVLSANLLSQIAVGATRRLQRGRAEDRLAPVDTVARIVAAHVEGLAAVACPAVLVTDVGYVRRDRLGRVVEEVDLTPGFEAAGADASWDWTVAPFGEEERDVERVHTVAAFDDVAMRLT